MSETEALSYLLTGKPLNATGESESGMLVNAAAKLGMKKSANRINRIRAKAGFDTLQLEAGDDLTESELVIGKYLSSRLYLEYVTKLFSDLEVFALRYEFSNNLHLEAESDADSQALLEELATSHEHYRTAYQMEDLRKFFIASVAAGRDVNVA